MGYRRYFVFAGCVAALLDAGADPSRPNLNGHRPRDYASSPAMRKLLDDSAVKVSQPANTECQQHKYESKERMVLFKFAFD